MKKDEQMFILFAPNLP